MRKTLLPLVASLALCGAGTAALVATTTARAEQPGRKPMMIALAGPSDTPTPSRAEGGPPHMQDGMREDGARRAEMCKEMYAHKVGELAFLEAKLSLSAGQAPLFARWKETSLDIAKRHETDCASHDRHTSMRGQHSSVVDRLALEEDVLKKRLADIQAERPALTAFYDSLTQAQKEEFGRGDMRRMAGRMRMMLGMMGRPHPGMGRGPMEHGPMGEAPPPPPAQ
jgi:hypothetical protein